MSTNWAIRWLSATKNEIKRTKTQSAAGPGPHHCSCAGKSDRYWAMENSAGAQRESKQWESKSQRWILSRISDLGSSANLSRFKRRRWLFPARNSSQWLTPSTGLVPVLLCPIISKIVIWMSVMCIMLEYWPCLTPFPVMKAGTRSPPDERVTSLQKFRNNLWKSAK